MLSRPRNALLLVGLLTLAGIGGATSASAAEGECFGSNTWTDCEVLSDSSSVSIGATQTETTTPRAPSRNTNNGSNDNGGGSAPILAPPPPRDPNAPEQPLDYLEVQRRPADFEAGGRGVGLRFDHGAS